MPRLETDMPMSHGPTKPTTDLEPDNLVGDSEFCVGLLLELAESLEDEVAVEDEVYESAQDHQGHQDQGCVAGSAGELSHLPTVLDNCMSWQVVQVFPYSTKSLYAVHGANSSPCFQFPNLPVDDTFDGNADIQHSCLRSVSCLTEELVRAL